MNNCKREINSSLQIEQKLIESTDQILMKAKTEVDIFYFRSDQNITYREEENKYPSGVSQRQI